MHKNSEPVHAWASLIDIVIIIIFCVHRWKSPSLTICPKLFFRILWELGRDSCSHDFFNNSLPVYTCIYSFVGSFIRSYVSLCYFFYIYIFIIMSLFIIAFINTHTCIPWSWICFTCEHTNTLLPLTMHSVNEIGWNACISLAHTCQDTHFDKSANNKQHTLE